MTPELQQILGILLGVAAIVFGAIRSELNARKAEAALRQARAERELAQLAAHEAGQEREQIIALGAALGASFERSSGVPAKEGK